MHLTQSKCRAETVNAVTGLLLVFAGWFTLNPPNRAAFIKFSGVNGSANVVWEVSVLRDEFRYFDSHSYVFLTARPSLSFFKDIQAGVPRPLASCREQFINSRASDSEDSIGHGFGNVDSVRPRYEKRIRNCVIPEPLRRTADGGTSYLNIPEWTNPDKQSVNEGIIGGCSKLRELHWSDILGNVPNHQLCPQLSQVVSERRFQGRRDGLLRVSGKGFLSLLISIPSDLSVGSVTIPSGHREQEFVAKCHNFTAVIMIFPNLFPYPTIRGHDNLILRQADDDYRAGFDLGECTRDQRQTKYKRERFHIRLLPDDGSMAMYDIAAKREKFYQHRVFLKFEKESWVELLGLVPKGKARIVPPGEKG
jgi:hypothetical protein